MLQNIHSKDMNEYCITGWWVWARCWVVSGALICSRLVRLALGDPKAQMQVWESTCSQQSSTGQESYQVRTCLVVCWWG